MCVFVSVCMHLYVCVCVYLYLNVYLYIYMHTHTCIHRMYTLLCVSLLQPVLLSVCRRKGGEGGKRGFYVFCLALCDVRE